MNGSTRSILGLITVCTTLAASPLCRASEQEGSFQEPPQPKPLLWVVETSEEDARMSLDRISGEHQSPYLTGDSAYSSENHHLASPFALSKLNESRE